MTTPSGSETSLAFGFSSNLIGMRDVSAATAPPNSATNSSVPLIPAVPPAPAPLVPVDQSSRPAVSDSPSLPSIPQGNQPAESKPIAIPALELNLPEALVETPEVRRTGIHETKLPLVETSHVWGLDFARVKMEEVLEYAEAIIEAKECQYFITANLNYVMLSHQNAKLKEVNSNAAAIIADGNPIVIRSQFVGAPLPCRVAGSDLIVELANLCADRGYRMFFLGAAPGVAAKAADKLKESFPDLQVAGCVAPPFRELSAEEHETLLCQIRAARPDVLLVAFGQPKGELWIHENYAKLGIPLSIQLGASFDFLAGTAKRAPRFWQAIGCEWLYRTCCEPKRLAPRYWKNIRFLASQVASDVRSLLR